MYDFNFYQGCSYLAIRELDKAKDYFDIALRIKPNDPATTYNMACLFSLQNDVDESVKWLRLALSLNPEYKKHISSDFDFNNIRSTKQFQDLLED